MDTGDPIISFEADPWKGEVSGSGILPFLEMSG